MKLITQHISDMEPTPKDSGWQLYDVENNILICENVSKELAEKIKRLLEKDNGQVS